MGTKRTRSRKYFFLYLACSVVLFVTGNACIRHVSTAPDKESKMDGANSIPADSLLQEKPGTSSPQETVEHEASRHLAAARSALAAGDYSAAFIEIEMASNHSPNSSRPETIFLTGLFYADPKNPTANITKANESLQLLENEHPESNRICEVRILSELLLRLQASESVNKRLRQDIVQLEKNLSAERNSVQTLKSLLKKMKEIDLEVAPKE